MNAEIFLAIFVGLGVIEFALRLYRKMLTSDNAEVPLGPGEDVDVTRQLSAIDQCRKILDAAILLVGLGTSAAYAYLAFAQ